MFKRILTVLLLLTAIAAAASDPFDPDTSVFAHGTPAEIRAFLSEGFDVNTVNGDGRTPLLVAIGCQNSSAAVEALLAAGAVADETAVDYARRRKAQKFDGDAGEADRIIELLGHAIMTATPKPR